MNKWVIGGLVAGGLGAAYYFFVPPILRVKSIDTAAKKIYFSVDGKPHDFSYQNTALGQTLTVRKVFSVSIHYMINGGKPTIEFMVSKGQKVVNMKYVEIDKPLLGI